VGAKLVDEFEARGPELVEQHVASFQRLGIHLAARCTIKLTAQRLQQGGGVLDAKALEVSVTVMCEGVVVGHSRDVRVFVKARERGGYAAAGDQLVACRGTLMGGRIVCQCREFGLERFRKPSVADDLQPRVS